MAVGPIQALLAHVTHWHPEALEMREVVVQTDRAEVERAYQRGVYHGSRRTVKRYLAALERAGVAEAS